MGVKITDMTADSSVTGVELFPVSDGGSAKKMSVSQVKDFVVDQIEAIAAGTAVSGADGIYILQSGALKPIDIDVIAQYVLDIMWAKAADASPTGASVVPLKKSSTEETMTLTVLAEFVRSTIEAAVLDVSNLSSAGALTDADLALVTQSTTGKKVTLSTLATYVLGALDTYVAALTGVSSPSDTDAFYVIQGGVEKKVTWATLKAAVGNCFAPATTTENNIPQWSSAQKTLKDGLTLQTAVRASGSAADTAVPSEKAVRDLANQLVYTQSDIGADLSDVDTVLVDDGAAGTAQRKSAISRLWTYIWAKITGATAKTTPVGADSIGIVDSAASNVVKNLTFTNLWDNYLLALAKAIKIDDFAAGDDNTDLNVSTTKHGLCPKGDGTTQNFLRGDGTWAQPFAQEFDTLWIPAGAMTPSVTAGADTEVKEYGTNDLSHDCLLFDGSAQDEYAEFNVVMPEAWDRSTIKAKLFWAPGHADANVDEVIGFYLAAGAFSNSDALDAALGTEQLMDDSVLADDDMHISPASPAITVGGTPALGDMIHFKLRRDYNYATGGVAMDVDCRVFGLLIQYKKTNTTTEW